MHIKQKQLASKTEIHMQNAHQLKQHICLVQVSTVFTDVLSLGTRRTDLTNSRKKNAFPEWAKD